MMQKASAHSYKFMIGRLAAAGIAATVLAACQTISGGHTGSVTPSTVEERHPITVGEEAKRLDLAIASDVNGLNESQVRSIGGFIQTYKQDGGGEIEIAAPTGSANEIATVAVLSEIRGILRDADVPDAAIHYKPYFVESENAAAPLSLTYRHLTASAKPCGVLTRNLAYNPQNKNYSNFGCATQRNLAAMIADPRDLVAPRKTDPRASERRQTIYNKYVKGEPTGAERSDEEKAEVSEAAQ